MLIFYAFLVAVQNKWPTKLSETRSIGPTGAGSPVRQQNSLYFHLVLMLWRSLKTLLRTEALKTYQSKASSLRAYRVLQDTRHPLRATLLKPLPPAAQAG